MLESLPGPAAAGPHPPEGGGPARRATEDSPRSTFDALVRRADRGPEPPEEQAEGEARNAALAGLAAWLPPPQAAVEAVQQGPDRPAEVPPTPPTAGVEGEAAIAVEGADAAPVDDGGTDNASPGMAPVLDPPPGLERAAERIAELGTPARTPPAHGARERFGLDVASQGSTVPAEGDGAAAAHVPGPLLATDADPSPAADDGTPPAPPTVAVGTANASPGDEVAATGDATTEVDTVELAARLAETVQRAATHGPRELRVTLRPPELGHLDLRVVEGRDGMRVAIEASTADARDLLQRELPALRAALEARDLRVQRLDVQLADRGQGGMLADGGPADRRDEPGRGQQHQTERGVAEPPRRVANADRRARVPIAPGRIDLRV